MPTAYSIRKELNPWFPISYVCIEEKFEFIKENRHSIKDSDSIFEAETGAAEGILQLVSLANLDRWSWWLF